LESRRQATCRRGKEGTVKSRKGCLGLWEKGSEVDVGRCGVIRARMTGEKGNGKVC